MPEFPGLDGLGAALAAYQLPGILMHYRVFNADPGAAVIEEQPEKFSPLAQLFPSARVGMQPAHP